jgi:gamma-glutamyl:cysteine ligase YbdK (ATP-grasp superfamily)
VSEQQAKPLSLFEGYGLEIEYAIVDAETLDVRPWADRLLRKAAGTKEHVGDHDDGDIGWSNELVNHVLEFKNAGPVPSLAGVDAAFDESLDRAQAILAEWSACLLPTGMHPWMDPAHETKIWSHEGAEIYNAYDRIFQCRRHGWSNVQATHLNLPFANEDEFVRLYAAARIMLPMLPALAASSPFRDDAASGLLDTRLRHYFTNSARVPAMTGDVIPGPLASYADYQRLLASIDAELGDLDRDKILIGNPWINARGAIARFDRMAIELRLLDTQECPRADVAICEAVAAATLALVEERWVSFAEQRETPTAALRATLDAAVVEGPAAPLATPFLATALGAPGAQTLGEVWRRFLAETALSDGATAVLDTILTEGTLAQRILAATGPAPSHENLHAVYTELAACLATGRMLGA